jgi:hypothetical protein
MKRWALGQGVDHLRVIVDDTGPVEVHRIKEEISRLVELTTVEQLVVYFAGHGVNNGRREYWLLSGAPDDSDAAVNVRGTAELAGWCQIPHVVFISDACRTAAEGIQAQSITGSNIFPNTAPSDIEQGVDLFYGSALGKPALEIKDPVDSAGRYSAIYTNALVEILEGKHAQALEMSEPQGFALVRPWPLKELLPSVVSAKFQALRPSDPAKAVVSAPVPDAHISSRKSAWVSRIELDVFRPARPRRGAPKTYPIVVPRTLQSVSRSILRGALSGQDDLVRTLEMAKMENVTEAKLLAASMARASVPFGPAHFATRCGFKVQGTRIAGAFSVRARAEMLDPAAGLIQIDDVKPPAANVLVTFEDGRGVVLPAIPDFLGALRFQEGELIDVAYEPSDNSGRWGAFAHSINEIRTLRAVIASSSEFGVFRLDPEGASEAHDALELARRMQYAKGLDPTTAIYAAYAYHELRRRDLIQEMQRCLRNDLQIGLFDLQLLGRTIGDKRVADPAVGIFPYCPLLSQGWSLLSAYRVSLPRSLESLQKHLAPSLWTLFDAQGVDRIRRAMETGEVA